MYTLLAKCDDGWRYYNVTDFCYYVGSAGNINNTEAQIQCKNQESYLASIHSQAENYFLVSKF